MRYIYCSTCKELKNEIEFEHYYFSRKYDKNCKKCKKKVKSMNNSLIRFLYGLIVVASVVLMVVFKVETELFLFIMIIELMIIFFGFRKTMDRIDKK